MYNSDKLLSLDGRITFQKIYFVRILEAQKYILFLNMSHKKNLIFIFLNKSQKNTVIFIVPKHVTEKHCNIYCS